MIQAKDVSIFIGYEKKNKVMAVLRDGIDEAEIVLNCQLLDKVETFKYVGGIVKNDEKHTEDVKMKTNSLQMLINNGKNETLWRNNNPTMSTMLKLYDTLVIPQILYGPKTWVLKKSDEKSLLVAEMSCLRKIMELANIRNY